MTTILAPICLGCSRFRKQEGDKFTCDAFTKGIPIEIIRSQADHRQPYAGDGGLQFLPQDEDAASYAALLFRDQT